MQAMVSRQKREQLGKEALQDMEKQLVGDVLERCGWKVCNSSSRVSYQS